MARVLTNCGEFEITLDPKRAPKTGGSFASLVGKRFYDGLTFHRIVPGFVIQGGDPDGTGGGGPGYSVTETPPADLTYTKGVVAMAKTATDPAGTSGSQFFVVTGEDAGLPPEYALLGKITKGQEVVDKIGVVPVGPGRGAHRARGDPPDPDHRVLTGALEREQHALALGPAAVGAEPAGGRQHAVAGDDDRDRVGGAGGADRAHGPWVAGLARERAVGDDLAAVDLVVQRLEHRAPERAADEREVDRQVEAVVVALEVARERVAGGGELAVGLHDPRPHAGRHAGERAIERLALERDPEDAARALDDHERADRGLERGVDGVGEALAHGGGGEPVEEGVGQGSHGVTLSRRVRTAVDTRWRAASGEVPSSTAMRS